MVILAGPEGGTVKLVLSLLPQEKHQDKLAQECLVSRYASETLVATVRLMGNKKPMKKWPA